MSGSIRSSVKLTCCTICLGQTILSLLDLKPTVVRGNASEILALAGADGTVRGVDSTAKPDDALVAAKRLARERQCIVAISGAEDLVRTLCSLSSSA